VGQPLPPPIAIFGCAASGQIGHEGLEIDAFLGLRGVPPNAAGGHFEGGEQVDRAVPFVGAFQAVNMTGLSFSDRRGYLTARFR
jgi:hypothetical protein